MNIIADRYTLLLISGHTHTGSHIDETILTKHRLLLKDFRS